MENISVVDAENKETGGGEESGAETSQLPRCCAIRFRPAGQPKTAISRLTDLAGEEMVMAQTEHGLEPALVHHPRHPCGPTVATAAAGAAEQPSPARGDETAPLPVVSRRATAEEVTKFNSLQQREAESFATARHLIAKHRLPMKLIRAERYFNGGKIIFYFTAENRVDFRELVKDLVQEFRTRVEIRQVGVRHETKMIGGLGCCGRELCCSSYIRNFAPVSIKMAKEQGLPLNPSKISGICNRLLCCLTYEFETYRQLRKPMPRPGKQVTLDGKLFKVLKLNVLEQSVEVRQTDDPERQIVWQASEWQRCAAATGDEPGDRKANKTAAQNRGKSS
ncbi:MAG: regulatory iron-sulfur-containing complex subunit RicT [Desulfurivibrio sp.]|nr:regulatory iron-sulfur-containing complex subunit RicT [Desulfurivibrio sp.]